MPSSVPSSLDPCHHVPHHPSAHTLDEIPASKPSERVPSATTAEASRPKSASAEEARPATKVRGAIAGAEGVVACAWRGSEEHMVLVRDVGRKDGKAKETERRKRRGKGKGESGKGAMVGSM